MDKTKNQLDLIDEKRDFLFLELEKRKTEIFKEMYRSKSKFLLEIIESVEDELFIKEIAKYDIAFILTILAAAEEDFKVCTINYDGYELNGKRCNFKAFDINHKGLKSTISYIADCLEFTSTRKVNTFNFFGFDLLEYKQKELGDFTYENEFFVNKDILNDLVLLKLKRKIFANLVPIIKESIKDVDLNLMKIKNSLLLAESIDDMADVMEYKTYR